MTANSKGTSLLHYGGNYSSKRFYDAGPRCTIFFLTSKHVEVLFQERGREKVREREMRTERKLVFFSKRIPNSCSDGDISENAERQMVHIWHLMTLALTALRVRAKQGVIRHLGTATLC